MFCFEVKECSVPLIVFLLFRFGIDSGKLYSLMTIRDPSADIIISDLLL